ncbi:GAP family protein [Rhodococcus sp. CX]|uniref:GAP family protein n=1 Tax=Rhodococcus sp. CX TaxID=2789880 RepID=UPI0018CD4E58|nr:GAP family protein [Rhodococcus sp. CX]MBH0122506.1 GAP family protein [Rhodococcus sp. CX]
MVVGVAISPIPIVATIKVAIELLIVLAGRQWRARGDASVPKWMQAIDRLNFPKATGLGIALSAVDPKNLLLYVSAGLVIDTGGLGTGEAVVALVIYTVIAASSVLIHVLGYAIAAQRLRERLDTLWQSLRANNHQVMAIVLVLMGAAVIGKGLGGL